MLKADNNIWFWQRIISPHMAALAAAMMQRGWQVTYVASAHMSADRARQGWQVPELGEANIELATTPEEIQALVRAAPTDSVHLCQGLRGNGLVGEAQRLIRQRGLRHWAIMETLDDAGWPGMIKRALYRGLFWRWRPALEGILAIGRDTPDWIVARGMPRSRVFPFAYFLRDPEPVARKATCCAVEASRAFRFIFVGQLIERKRLEVLIEALAALGRDDIELWVVGAGPLEPTLRSQATRLLPGRVNWLGLRPMPAVPALIAEADCLVLPSRHDGWGAVASEAFMVGTPAICSNACGAAEAVLASKDGGVFPAGDTVALRNCLERQVELGVIGKQRRRALADWASCLGAKAGAAYLSQILQYQDGEAERPDAPWGTGHKGDLIT